MESKQCILMYSIRISCDDILENIMFPQVVTWLTSPICSNHADAQVGHDKKTITTCTIVPGQGNEGMEAERVRCMTMLARREGKLVSRALFSRRCNANYQLVQL